MAALRQASGVVGLLLTCSAAAPAGECPTAGRDALATLSGTQFLQVGHSRMLVSAIFMDDASGFHNATVDPPTSITPTVLPQFLIAHYRMEPAGTTIADSSSNGRDGVMVNAAAITDGLKGGAVRFASSGSSRVDLPTSACVAGSNPRTIAFWYRSKASLSGWNFGFGFGQASNNCNHHGSFNSHFRSDGTLGFMGCGADYAEDSGNGIRVNDGDWHHIAYTFAHDQVKTYTDGVFNWVYQGGNLNTKCEAAYISSHNDQRVGGPAAGDIDEFVIYSKALSIDEIQSLMQADMATR